MRANLLQVKEQLGQGGGSKNMAQLALEMFEIRSKAQVSSKTARSEERNTQGGQRILSTI